VLLTSNTIVYSHILSTIISLFVRHSTVDNYIVIPTSILSMVLTKNFVLVHLWIYPHDHVGIYLLNNL